MKQGAKKLLSEIKSKSYNGICLFASIEKTFDTIEENLKAEPSKEAKELIDKIYSNMRHGVSGKAYFETSIL